MPKKLSVLLQQLANAGFTSRGGKGSHRNYTHPGGYKITISVHAGEAKRWAQREIEDAIEAVKPKETKDNEGK